MNRVVSYAEVARAAALLEDEATTHQKAIESVRRRSLHDRLRFLDRVLLPTPTGDAKLDRTVGAMQTDDRFLWMLLVVFGPLAVVSIIVVVALPFAAIAREVTERELHGSVARRATLSKMVFAWLLASFVAAGALSWRDVPVGLSAVAVVLVAAALCVAAALRGEWTRRRVGALHGSP